MQGRVFLVFPHAIWRINCIQFNSNDRQRRHGFSIVLAGWSAVCCLPTLYILAKVLVEFK
jgi:hypothetical protein